MTHADLRVPAARLAGADDAELAWRVIEPAYAAVSLHDGPEALATQLGRLTAGQRALFALHWCVAETSNGGFDQFFTNPSGLLADEARAGFERIGAPEAARLLDRAYALLASRPDEGDDHDARFEAYLERYAPLEERFHDLVDAELYPRAAAYVRAHPDEFTRPQPRIAAPRDGA